MARVVKAEELTPRGREMAALIAQWEDSGQTMQEFAPRHGVSKQALGWWRWKLKRRSAAAARGAPREAIRLVEIARVGTEATSFEVRLANGVAVTVPAGFDRDALTELLAVLRTC
jgi:transposase-like protein